jgi:SAM-dependent methyltransferase
VHNVTMFNLIVEKLKLYFGDSKSINILDLGCGRRYPFTLLLNSAGYRVTGIDTLYINPDAIWISEYVDNLRFNGPQVFAKALVESISQSTAKYNRKVQEISGINLNSDGIRLYKMNAETLCFEKDSFDFVISIFVFEHLMDLDKAIVELYRVIKPTGILFLAIDLFTGTFGAHWPYSQRKPSVAWQHLVDSNMYIHNGLNKLRENDFIKALNKKFKLLELIRIIDEEGRKLLTQELQQRLSLYAQEELLTDRLILVMQNE